MPWPTLSVSIATAATSTRLVLDDDPRGFLDTGTLGDTFGRVWTAITNDVLQEDGISINRGSTRQAGPYFATEAGRMQLRLDNRSGDYDPLNLGSPYVVAGVSKLLPGLPIKVEATYRGTTFILFSGFVDSWSVAYPGTGNTTSIASVTASDPVARLVAANPSPELAAVGTGETVSARLNRILDRVGWSAEDRRIEDTGTATLVGTELGKSAWTEMLNTATSVNGYLWLNTDGEVQYQEKSSFPRSVELMLGDDGAMPVVELEFANDWDQIYNTVKLARVEGTTQSIEDSTSIAKYGIRTFERTDLLVANDDLVSESADYLLSQFKEQDLRLEAVVLEPDDSYSDDAWSVLLGLELLKRVGATIQTTDGRQIVVQGLVRGVELNASSYQWQWTLSTVAAPDTVGDFTLDDQGRGLLADWTPEQRAVLEDYWDWLQTHSPYPATSFTEGLEAWVYSFHYSYQLFSWYIQEQVDTTQSAVTTVPGYADWVGLTFAQWQATEYDYPALALF